MAKKQLEERNVFRYPPYTRLINITVRSRDERLLESASSYLSSRLQQSLGKAVSNPVIPTVSRVRLLHIRTIILKIDISYSIQKMRHLIDNIEQEIKHDTRFKNVSYYYDVDPQ
ncbi:MAG: hypothetical protein LBJ47_08380 [Tannerella sp.]|jgi:primosomal protein N' (replication factor Y)|nr:hypothetical protein [Tannerella sp.]